MMGTLAVKGLIKQQIKLHFTKCYQAAKCFKIFVKKTSNNTETVILPMLSNAEMFQQSRHVECCVRKLFVLMKVVLNGKSNLCIPQTTSKTLFFHCSLVVEVFKQFRHTESCVRNFFVPMKYVIDVKNNKDIPQTTRRTLFYHCSCAVKVFQQLKHIENCLRKFFVPMKVVINGKSNLCILQTTRKTLFCYCS